MPPHPHALPEDLARHPTPTTTLLARIVERLATRGSRALRQIGHRRLLDCWAGTVEAFRDPASSERQELDTALTAQCRLSPAGLNAALEAVLAGVARGPATALFQRAASLAPAAREQPAWIILASNLPALAVQPLLPALARGRSVILKSPSVEPSFTPRFVRALCAREPRLEEAIVALTWRGGDREIEAPLLASCAPIVAYGEAATLVDLEARAAGRIVGHGPKTSLAMVSHDADPATVAQGLARDIALFDQRGCLSVAAVYTAGDGSLLASELAAALHEQAGHLPPGPPTVPEAVAVQQLRGETQMRGLESHFLDLASGTVLVDPEPSFHPSPGLRTVRIHPLPRLSSLPDLLTPWQGQLQGAALAGEAAWQLVPRLRSLGISRYATVGELQFPDASWENEGSLLELF